jgi:hypothetical protein
MSFVYGGGPFAVVIMAMTAFTAWVALMAAAALVRYLKALVKSLKP